jgi:hypothetical protein
MGAIIALSALLAMAIFGIIFVKVTEINKHSETNKSA